MSTSARVTANLPTIASQPGLELEDGRAPCQVYSRTWVAGRGFAFTYCETRQSWLISWSVDDQWHTRRQLRVCLTHGREFAEAHGLRVSLAPGTTDQGGRGARADSRVPSAEGPIAARKTPVEASGPDDPFADDADSPYARIREGSAG